MESITHPYMAQLLSRAIAAIVPLLKAGRPSAIAGLIMSVVVDAINGVLARRSVPHVCKESVERISPSGAHSNTAPAVVWIASRTGYEASRLHTGPHSVSHRVSQPVRRVLHGRDDGAIATATLRLSKSQIAAFSSRLVAAFAYALPITAPNLRRSPQHSQLTEPLVGEINECWHRANFTPVYATVI